MTHTMWMILLGMGTFILTYSIGAWILFRWKYDSWWF